MVQSDNLDDDMLEEVVEEIEEKINSTVSYTDNVYYKYTPSDYSFSISALPTDKLNTKLLDLDNKLNKEDISRKELQNWKKEVEDGLEYLFTPGTLHENSFTTQGSKWRQGLLTEAGDLKTIHKAALKPLEGEIKGESAILRIATLINTGAVVTIPLPHSGMWVSLTPPSDATIISFYNTIYNDKATLGRATNGLTLGNFSVVLNSRIFELIKSHIYKINFSDIDIKNTAEKILISDLPILIWGFACTQYPAGFNIKRQCVNDPSVCTHLFEGTVDLKKLLWINNNALTQTQKKILNEHRSGKHTIESYNKYKTEHTVTVPSSFIISDIVEDTTIKINLRTPTISEYVSDGYAWVNELNESVESVVLGNAVEEEKVKDETLKMLVNSSMLRIYSHYVDTIEVNDSVMKDRDTINAVLANFTSIDALRTTILSKINKYISDSTLALIGIPSHTCPECNKEQNTEPVNDSFVDVIPLDVLPLFFGLLMLRMSRIETRSR